MLHVSLLGERTIVDDVTGEVRSRSSRTVALVALLAVHAGAPQPRGRIAATFWPSSPEQQALTNLRRELHQLRRTLADDDSLVVTSTDLAWRDRDSCRVDLRDFQRARERLLAAEPEDTAPSASRCAGGSPTPPDGPDGGRSRSGPRGGASASTRSTRSATAT